ncbi:glycoside hydrolase family 127 protein [Glycomyces sp. TRM65418]|uniref:glycoside hydrolase family 127 protein n=1 Tax=Glycomyces sp. TRM65418 TaxID=2867006 RepID=UPI001CE66340|nr:beta-L-arabinofuranosidase domain-containing protein [Glycomyces sp. TRM65418]MCC3765122.1 glycoside hydrolase family 127 protein [Glycomyces sp. TRM65418]QZD54751.1 glycoside hydrolase family 127 protein [Glycomyces sp. TRM65418]
MPAPHRTALPVADVAIADEFWSPRRAIVRTGTIPHQERRLREGGQFEALRLEPRSHDDDERERFPIFWESDVAKWIEAASYVLASEDDPELEAAVDEAIALLAGAQQEDGYLNSYFTAVKPGKRFTDLRDAHELYCAGHLIEAGVAHFEATGKTALLDVVRRYADLIDREFGPGGSCEGGYDGHQEIELALVKLFRATGERRYLDLASRLIENRGREPFYFDAEAERRGDVGYFGKAWSGDGALVRDDRRSREYNQTHAPVREQDAVVGHAVRAMYQYCAMADLALELGDAGLRAACERLWDDLVSSKLYVTGGIGSDPSIEGFGPAFDLPDRTGYAETCAAIGLVFWAHRMMLLTGEAKYVEVLERALYNGVLSGVSADGTRFFYGNPLAGDGTVERSDWFDCACCPPNLARLLASLEQYVYVADGDGLTVNLYVSGTAEFDHAGNRVQIEQESAYPWDGRIVFDFDLEAPLAMTLRLRLPEWTVGAPTIAVNGTVLPYTTAQGYAVLARTWAPGDRVVLTLPMAPVLVRADPRVESARGKVAIQRGPIVHCVEEVDNEAPVPDLVIVRDGGIHTERVDGRDQVVAAGLVDRPAEGGLYRTGAPTAKPTEIRTVPYYAWGNRGKGTMAVWIRECPSVR